MAAIREREEDYITNAQPALDLDLPGDQWGEALETLAILRDTRKEAEVTLAKARQAAREAQRAEEQAIQTIMRMVARSKVH